MQLILDTDIDLSVQTKMSTIQQESLNEKFINTSLIENVCSDTTDISNVNDECQNQQVVVKVCEKKVETVEPIAQQTSQKPMTKEKVNDVCVELREICDKELTENKRNRESVISVQIENRNEVQEKENREIVIQSGTLVEEKKMEVNNLDKLEESKEYKNDNEIDCKTEEENKRNYNLDKDELSHKVSREKIEKQIKDHIEINKIEAQDDVNNSMVENKIEQQVKSLIEERIELTNKIEDKIETQNHDNIDMGLVIEGHDNIDSSVTANKIVEEVNVTHIIEHENEKPIEENIEIDMTIEEQNKVSSSVTEHEIEEESKVEDQIKRTSEIENKPVKEIRQNSEINITFEEQNNVNTLLTDDKTEERNEKDSDMDITFEEQDNVNTLVTDDNTEERSEKDNELDIQFEEQNNLNTLVIDDKTEEKTEKNSEINITFEEQDNVNTLVKDDKTEERNENDNEMDIKLEEQDNFHTLVTDDKTEERNEKDSEINITFEEQDNVNTLVTDDKTEERNEKDNEMDIKFEEQDNVNTLVTDDKTEEKTEKNSEMDITFEEQDNVNTFVTDDKMEGKNEKDSEMDITFEEQDNVNNLVTDDKTEGTNEKDSEMDVTLEEQGTLETDEIKEGNDEISEMDVTFEEQNKATTHVTEDKTEKLNEENSEMEVIFEEQDKFNVSVTEDEIEALHTEKGSVLDEVKDIKIRDKEKADNLNYSTKENKTEEHSKEDSEIKSKFEELYNVGNEVKDETEEQAHKIGEQIEKNCEIEVNCEDQQNEISAMIEKEEEEEHHIKDNIKEQDNKNSESKDMQITELSVTNDIVENRDKVSTDECKKNKLEYDLSTPRVDCVKDTVEKQQNDTSNYVSQDFKNLESGGLSREVVDQIDISGIVKDVDVESKTKDHENILVNTEETVEIQDERSKTRVSQMDPDEVIDIADEKDEDFTKDQDISVKEKEPENVEEVLISQEKERKTESALGNDGLGMKRTFSDVILNDKSSPEASVQETNVQVTNIKKPKTENVEEKKKLMHISKLSNTLDILSDEEEDLPKEEPNKEILVSADKECTSINIDDDDDIMLIDEESSPNDYKNKTESMPEPENQGIQKVEATLEANDKVEQCSEVSENKKDTTQTEVDGPSITDMKTSETKPDLRAQEETPLIKKPFVQPNFLKTCKKNLADMTRDELEEFCILKIVESVVDRSNLSEIKSQLKAMAQNIDEYQKKALILTKQNRDLQVVLKSIQEEQKKKSNMPITPLKITRSVGMQVLMTDKVSVRKKVQNPNTAKNNAAANSGPNRQGKTAQSQIRLQKILTNTSNSPQIPVPRLIPAVNNSSLNNMKIQPISGTTTGKVASPISSSPIQNVSNGLPATPPAQKPEKRPLSRMQQNNSVTVDLTDDEPPTKVVARNATPPVRLVPPQNLLAPHRQPFGQSVSTPRKVYIPISGSQSPVGVRPGQTIMLKTISPQGPRQRAPTPGIAKPNQVPNAVRMQRLGSRHPAPLPDSVKQYQPLNWKALPPAPELKLSKVENGIVISWKIDGYQEENHEEIASYQLYAYQETTSPPSTALWKKIGDVKALPLPMACTLTQFMAGYKYYFAVRAVDVRSRLGPFSMPGSILLLNKM